MGIESTYRRILKGTTLFGGSQVIQILVALARGKLIAVLLGPYGMGLSAIFSSSAEMLVKGSSLGLNLAIVKDTARASVADSSLNDILAVSRRLILFTSLLGALLCITLSPWLSRFAFGDTSATTLFILLSIFVAFSVAYSGNLSILQGLGEIKKISLATSIGCTTGLIAGIPFYYFLGDKGIVMALVVLSLAMFISYTLALRQSSLISDISFNWKRHRPIVYRLIVLGSLLMANDLIGSLVQYFLNIIVNVMEGSSSLGLYQSSRSIISQFSGVIFATLAMDYFPRLSSCVSNNTDLRLTVNRQIEINAYILTPLTCILITLSPSLIKIMLSQEFLSALPLIRCMALASLIRSLCVPLGYVILAKGNKKLYFWMEGVGANLLTLSLSIGGFHIFGLIGLGYAMIADNIICFVAYYLLNRELYGFSFEKKSVSASMSAAILGGGCCLSSFINFHTSSYILMSFVMAGSIAWGSLGVWISYKNLTN